MKISGWTFIRNGEKFGYPFLQSIQSILPICDEFIVNYSKSDDRTLELLQSIKEVASDSRETVHCAPILANEKLTIIESNWDDNLREGGQILARQTDIGLSYCTGDWCFYLQADEVVHEKYLPVIKENCEKYLNNSKVEGLLFDYLHFYGGYNTYFDKRPFYRKEIRIVRNNIGVKSYRDAQGFRIGDRKLNVIEIDAAIYHYGWVKNEGIMMAKQKNLDGYWHSDDWIKKRYNDKNLKMFTNIEGLKYFTVTHPEVMLPLIKTANLTFNPSSEDIKVKSLWKRIRNFIEDKILKTQLGEYKNYRIIKD